MNISSKEKEKIINDTIINAFNYYNGRINLCNPAKLIIDWECNDKTAFGSYYLPNVVVIYGLTFRGYKYFNNIDDLRLNIVLTVIHELFHCDQVVIYSKPDYNCIMADLEYAVETQVYMYANANRNEFIDVFGIDIYKARPDFDQYVNTLINLNCKGYRYHRRDEKKYIYMILYNWFDDMITNDLYDKLINMLNDNVSYISLIVNDNELILKNKDYICDPATLSGFTYIYLKNNAKCILSKRSINHDSSIMQFCTNCII